jgi:MoxR-like ATPase
MHPLILLVNQLKNLGDETQINAYLDLQKQLLEFTGLKADDPRMSMYVRKEGDVSISINSRRVLGLVHRQKDWRIELMINESDLIQARKINGYLSNLDESFSTRIGVPACLIRFDLAAKPYEDNQLLQLWQNSILAYLNTATATPYPKKHNNCLFAATMNKQAREQLLEWIEKGNLTEKELENEAIIKLFNLDKSMDTPSVFGTHSNKNDINNMPNFPLNQILYGPPGTGKTYHTINKALAIIENKSEIDLDFEDRIVLKNRFDAYVETGQIVFTTFHQSMSYEDFIEGIKPETIDDKVAYAIKNGIFKSICLAALTPNQVDFNDVYDKLKKDLSELEVGEKLDLKTPTGKTFSISLNTNENLTLHTGKNKEKQGTLTKENIQKQLNGEAKFVGWEGYFKGVIEYFKTKYNYDAQLNAKQNYVLIIDEINRGNVSQIFGELITLIEDDKRLGRDEALKVTLPYSKEPFGVPQNVFIIGTMNTADRSVEALDTALRRRFSFVEMPPQYDLAELDVVIADYSLSEILATINKRIVKLLNKDNLIGHSYFMSVNDADALKAVFQNKILPLLQEYFFGDYGKIGLVLGIGFVEKQPLESNVFSDFDYEDGNSDFENRIIYQLKNVDGMDDDAFTDALHKLMNSKK